MSVRILGYLNLRIHSQIARVFFSLIFQYVYRTNNLICNFILRTYTVIPCYFQHVSSNYVLTSSIELFCILMQVCISFVTGKLALYNSPVAPVKSSLGIRE